MSLYEVITIARQDLSLEDVDSLIKTLSAKITDSDGKVVSKEYWGLRSLAYEIKKNLRGHYFLLNVSAPYATIEELRRVLTFNSDVIRSMILAVENHHPRSKLFVANSAAESINPKTEESSDDVKIDAIIAQLQFE